MKNFRILVFDLIETKKKDRIDYEYEYGSHTGEQGDSLPDYVYHSTRTKNIPSIRREGIKPNTSDNIYDYTNPDFRQNSVNNTFFTLSPKRSEFWRRFAKGIIKPSPATTLRIRSSSIKGSIERDHAGNSDLDRKVQKGTVPPEGIDFFTPQTGWTPLSAHAPEIIDRILTKKISVTPKIPRSRLDIDYSKEDVPDHEDFKEIKIGPQAKGQLELFPRKLYMEKMESQMPDFDFNKTIEEVLEAIKPIQPAVKPKVSREDAEAEAFMKDPSFQKERAISNMMLQQKKKIGRTLDDLVKSAVARRGEGRVEDSIDEIITTLLSEEWWQSEFAKGPARYEFEPKETFDSVSAASKQAKALGRGAVTKLQALKGILDAYKGTPAGERLPVRGLSADAVHQARSAAHAALEAQRKREAKKK